MQNKKIKIYNYWRYILNWIFRLIIIAFIVVLLFNFKANVIGFSIATMISLILLALVNDSLIEVYNDRICLERKYLFGFIINRKTIYFSEIKKIYPKHKSSSNIEEFLFLDINSQLIIIKNNGKIIRFNTFVSSARLDYLSKKIIKSKNI